MGRKIGLTQADVVEAGAQIADAEGLEAVTMASVAARLGVRSPSLYAHVAGLNGLRRLLALRAADALGGALREAAGAQRGLDALRAMAFAYRRFAGAHPGLYAAAQQAVRPGEDEALYRALARSVAPAFQALEQAGVRESDRVHLARGFRAALHGFVALERSGGFGMPESVAASFEGLVELLLSGIQSGVAPGPGFLHRHPDSPS